jgi:hypothetical protein
MASNQMTGRMAKNNNNNKVFIFESLSASYTCIYSIHFTASKSGENFSDITISGENETEKVVKKKKERKKNFLGRCDKLIEVLFDKFAFQSYVNGFFT